MQKYDLKSGLEDSSLTFEEGIRNLFLNVIFNMTNCRDNLEKQRFDKNLNSLNITHKLQAHSWLLLDIFDGMIAQVKKHPLQDPNDILILAVDLPSTLLLDLIYCNQNDDLLKS